ncbi:MAG: hypothetical protein J1F31_06135 [Erysipelotrichales bacterium]|nr:hypothetical protein [Erysipelotrichales bacterium]
MRKKKNKQSLKHYANISFLSERKRMLNELSDDVIYEESQTGPQEEPTLKEIHLNIANIENAKKKSK